MIIRRNFAVLLGGIFLSAPVAASQSAHFYVKPYAGISYMNDVKAQTGAANIDIELEKGMALGAAFGYRYNANIAAELAWEYRSNGSESQVGAEFYPDGNYASNLIYLNGVYFFDPIGKLTPYIGAGVGWMQEIDIDLERSGVETSFSNSGNWSYQGFVGIEYRWSAVWSFHTELRHAGAKSGQLKDEQTKALFSNLNYKPFTWQLGAKYQF